MNRAGLGIERVQRLGMPDEQLPLAARLVDDRRRVTRLLCAQGAPEFFAGVLVEGHCHAALPANKTNEFAPVDEWVPGESPHRSFDGEVLFEIARPDFLSSRRVEALKISLRAERVDFSAADGRGRTRSGGVTHGIPTIVFVLPKQLAVAFRETNQALGAGNFSARKRVAGLGAISLPPVHDINAAVGHRGSSVTKAEWHTPADDGTIRWKFLKQSILAPDAIAFGTEPLR